LFPAHRSFWNSSAHNAIQPPPPAIHLRLQFRDPEGNVRDFPPGYPLQVRFTQGPNFEVIDGVTGDEGRVSFLARIYNPWSAFTLEFNAPGIPYFVCEPNLSPPAPATELRLISPPIDEKTMRERRFFALPQTWTMPQADWSPPPTVTPSGRFAAGTFYHTLSPPADISIGTDPNPVALILDPHWKYVRFEYYDRYFGNDSLDSPPRAGLNRRIAIPPIALEGFQSDPAAAGTPADTVSNWVIDPTNASDLTRVVQCLPWIVRRQPDTTPLAVPFDGANMGLRFKTTDDPNVIPVVYSEEADKRKIEFQSPPTNPPVSSPPDVRKLDPGPDRLRYYDLPRVWKSQHYFARNVPNSPPGASPPDGQFFDQLFLADLALSDAAAQPITFSLDDIVLTDDGIDPITLDPPDQVTIFHHRFANRVLSPPAAAAAIANVSTEGIWKRQMAAPVDLSPPQFPYSFVGLRRRHYITDYPDWTRLVTAQGNMFDVFADRTIETGTSPVTGARAAVRWVDATDTGVGWAAGTDITGAALPALVSQPFFAIQPFYSQDYLERSHDPEDVPTDYDEWAAPHASAFTNGRFDIAHIRCTDTYNDSEISVVMRYQRFSLDFSPNLDGNPYQGLPAGVDPGGGSPPRVDWTQMFYQDVADRWNGADAYSTRRPFIVSSPPFTSPPASPPPSPPTSPPRPLITHVVTHLQNLPPGQAHFQVRTIQTSGTSSMSRQVGTGVLRVNALPHDDGVAGTDLWGRNKSGRGLAAAHEVGHCGGMPDEYRPGPTRGGAAPNTYILLQNYTSNHVLGNPYILDDYALMKGNWFIRARYLWHVAEWLHSLPEFPNDGFMVHNFRGALEETYTLPFYRHNSPPANPAYPGRNYMNWPVRYNLRLPPAGAPNVLCDSVLYLLGQDEYSREVLPNLVTARRNPGTVNHPAVPRAANDQIDGFLVVMLRINVEIMDMVPDVLSDADLQTVTNRVYARVQTKFDRFLNRLYCAAFQPSASLSPPFPFRRCLLHFVPCLATLEAGGWPDAAAWSVEHLHVRMFDGWGGGPIWNQLAAPGPNALDLDIPGFGNAELDGMADLIFAASCMTLGLDQNPNNHTPPDFVPIVRTVMDAAAPNPVVT
jgi:hypothetical protein